MAEKRWQTWAEKRAEAIAAGRITEEGIAAGRARIRAAQRAYRLAEIRKEFGLRQADVADAMDVSQRRVSALERGDLHRSELGTIEAYVNALGGRVEIVADFGNERVVVGDSDDPEPAHASIESAAPAVPAKVAKAARVAAGKAAAKSVSGGTKKSMAKKTTAAKGVAKKAATKGAAKTKAAKPRKATAKKPVRINA